MLVLLHSIYLLLLVLSATATVATPVRHVYPSVLDNNNQVTTKMLLQNISEWILTTDLPTNNLTKTSDKLKTSIFINGNLARTLLAAAKIFNNSAYLSTGLAWCDTLVTLQTDQLTSQGHDGGWWDTGYSELYIADTGTAVTCLALCYDLATNNARKQQYMTAMLKFSEFVVNGTQSTPVCTFSPGCHYDSLGNNTETTNTWVLKDGSLGDGYYMHHLNLPSYTISTATTGGCFFAEMYALTGREDFKTMASQATAWLLEHVQANGTIPYYIYPPTTIPHEYQCTSYSAVREKIKMGKGEVGGGGGEEGYCSCFISCLVFLICNVATTTKCAFSICFF